MMQLAVLMIALVVIFAIKAISITKTHEELAENCSSFSWASIRPQDQETAASWTTEESVEERMPVSYGVMRQTGRARA